MLHKEAPLLDSSVAAMMVDLAQTLRKSYGTGTLQVVLSTRIVVAWGLLLQSFSHERVGQRDKLLTALQASFLFRVGRTDRAAIETAVKGVLSRTA